MPNEGEKTPDAAPMKDVIHTPPRMPNLPGGGNEKPKSSGALKGKPFDFKAAVARTMDSEAGSASPLMKPRHERGVSWDANVSNNERMASSPVQLAARTTDPSGSPSLLARSNSKQGNLPPRPTQVVRNTSSSSGKASTYEQEAEDALLRDLEERDPMHRKAFSGTNILVGVPDEIHHNFQPDDDAPPAPRPRLMSGDPSIASRRPPPKPQPVKSHKRQLTVEEALFGLTAALSAVHDDEKLLGERNHQEASNNKIDSADSQDRLAKTAELMFGKRFMKKRTSVSVPAAEQSDSSSNVHGIPSNHGPSRHEDEKSNDNSDGAPAFNAKSKWGLVKANLDIHKKFDMSEGVDEENEIELEGVDIEEGGNGPNPMNSTDEESDSEQDRNRKSNKKRRGKKIRGALAGPFRHLPYADKIKNEWDLFHNFLHPRKTTMFAWARYIILYLWIPALSAAAILYHITDNPPTGRGPFDKDDPTGNATSTVDKEPVATLENKASISWWIIFICLREVGILVIAKCVEAVIVDFLAIQTRAILRTFGPVITLLFVQSKGWPFLMSSWGIINFLLVTGNNPFNHHWLYWQDVWGLFNEYNPSGDVTNTRWLSRICAVTSILGAAVSVKRVAIGIYLGRQTFANYSDQLALIMNKMLQVSQVAILSQAIEKKYWADIDKANGDYYPPAQADRESQYSRDNLLTLIESANDEGKGEGDVSIMDMTHGSGSRPEDLGQVIDTTDVDPFTGGLSDSQKIRIADLLGRWEEPGRGHLKSDYISVGAVLQFRRALASMDTPYPFSGSFGFADTRESCVASAQNVYERLMLKNQTVNGKLHFDTLATLALQGDGQLDSERAKELIRMFRPDRDGGISCVEFVRSVDAVYKDLRMLRATVAASSKIDKALESILNIVFYVVTFCIILAAWDIDPLALFLSLSSIILAFAFMIGSASAKYFEGLLFILVQRPYGIGDRINVSNPESETNGGGAQGWIVDDVTLFTTTVYMVGTNEKATISNGSLAKSRIINGARSHKAVVVLTLKFGLESKYEKIEIFKAAVEKFVKARPREWLSLLGLRAGRVEADLGFVEYVIVLQHRESWQNAGPIFDSKHSIHCFMLELVKKLNLRYQQPALPILLDQKVTSAVQAQYGEGSSSIPNSPRSLATNDDVNNVFAMFEGR